MNNEKKYKFGIIGAGTVGVISTLILIENLLKWEKGNEAEIYLIHDPKLPKIAVGETTTYSLLDSLDKIFGINETRKILEKCNFVHKHYAKFFWEEGLGHNFIIPHTSRDINFDSLLLSEALIEKFSEKFNNFNLIEKNVVKLKSKKIYFEEGELDLDYIIDCSGWPSKEQLKSDYEFPEFETVNSGFIYQNKETVDEEFMSSYYHDDGWVFGIPLQNRKTFGFLYNNKITSEETARENFKRKFNFVEEDKIKSINWKFYYRKKCVEDNILYMGNKLYFFEPTGALPLHFFMGFLHGVFKNIINENGFKPFKEFETQINMEYKNEVEMMFSLISLNYVGCIKRSTKFWNETRKKCVNYLKTNYKFQKYIETCMEEGKIQRFWSHNDELMNHYINGFGIKLKELRGE